MNAMHTPDLLNKADQILRIARAGAFWGMNSELAERGVTHNRLMIVGDVMDYFEEHGVPYEEQTIILFVYMAGPRALTRIIARNTWPANEKPPEKVQLLPRVTTSIPKRSYPASYSPTSRQGRASRPTGTTPKWENPATG